MVYVCVCWGMAGVLTGKLWTEDNNQLLNRKVALKSPIRVLL